MRFEDVPKGLDLGIMAKKLAMIPRKQRPHLNGKTLHVGIFA